MAACAVLLAACQPDPAAEKHPLEMAELMAHVIDPAAFMVWKSAGVEVTEAGERELYPTTDEGWMVVENGAAIVAEAGALLKLPGRPREPEADWNRYADLMTERALAVMAAAEAKDKQAVFDAGGRLYEVCQGCHQQFIEGAAGPR